MGIYWVCIYIYIYIHTTNGCCSPLTSQEALLNFLADLLLIPDPETVTRALVGLTSWSAQLWNMVIHGEVPTKSGAMGRDSLW